MKTAFDWIAENLVAVVNATPEGRSREEFRTLLRAAFEAGITEGFNRAADMEMRWHADLRRRIEQAPSGEGVTIKNSDVVDQGAPANLCVICGTANRMDGASICVVCAQLALRK